MGNDLEYAKLDSLNASFFLFFPLLVLIHLVSYLPTALWVDKRVVLMGFLPFREPC